MSRRRLVSSLAALALAVALVWLAYWWFQPPPQPRQLVGPPRSDYTLSNFTAWIYAPDGSLSFRIRSPSLERRKGDRSLYIDKPHFLLPPAKGKDTAPWHGQSAYGWVNADHSVLKLMGPVHMQRAANADTLSADIRTSDVTIWPQQHKLATAKAAHLREGTSRMSGVGLRADLAAKTMELLHDVHGTFLPSTHP